MKKADRILIFMMCGNILLTIMSVVIMFSADSIVKAGARLADTSTDMMVGADPNSAVDGWNVMGGLLGLAGSVALAVVGAAIMFFAILAFIVYCVPTVFSIVTKVKAKRYYAQDIEKCRVKMKTAAIISTAINAAPFLVMLVFILGSVGWMYIYVLLSIWFFMGATLTFSVIEIILTNKSRWYIYGHADKQIYEDVETRNVE
ncbi:MAG: hypothetical protein MJ104_07175 [Lachnospiraceae bacterium]|nr:hypothetical protein [Lachnospiraceae bacterium]